MKLRECRSILLSSVIRDIPMQLDSASRSVEVSPELSQELLEKIRQGDFQEYEEVVDYAFDEVAA